MMLQERTKPAVISRDGRVLEGVNQPSFSTPLRTKLGVTRAENSKISFRKQRVARPFRKEKVHISFALF